MSTNICAECTENKIEKWLYCDMCKKEYCYYCSKLKASELKVIELSSRILKFYCDYCQNYFNKISTLQEAIINSNCTIKKLNEKVAFLTKENSCLSREISDYEEESLKIQNKMRKLKEMCVEQEKENKALLEQHKTMRNQSFLRGLDIKENERLFQMIASLKNTILELTCKNDTLINDAIMNQREKLISESMIDEKISYNLQENKKDGENESTKQRKLIIISDEQGVCLSAELRERNIFLREEFQITGFVKPGATTEKVLSVIYESQNYANLTKKDYVVICTGYNDENPMKVVCELSSTLRILKSTNVFIISAACNPYVNVEVLNQYIYRSTYCHKNATFLNCINKNVPDHLWCEIIRHSFNDHRKSGKFKQRNITFYFKPMTVFND